MWRQERLVCVVFDLEKNPVSAYTQTKEKQYRGYYFFKNKAGRPLYHDDGVVPNLNNVALDVETMLWADESIGGDLPQPVAGHKMTRMSRLPYMWIGVNPSPFHSLPHDDEVKVFRDALFARATECKKAGYCKIDRTHFPIGEECDHIFYCTECDGYAGPGAVQKPHCRHPDPTADHAAAAAHEVWQAVFRRGVKLFTGQPVWHPLKKAVPIHHPFGNAAKVWVHEFGAVLARYDRRSRKGRPLHEWWLYDAYGQRLGNKTLPASPTWEAAAKAWASSVEGNHKEGRKTC
jgi:hypothetical protein